MWDLIVTLGLLSVKAGIRILLIVLLLVVLRLLGLVLLRLLVLVRATTQGVG